MISFSIVTSAQTQINTLKNDLQASVIKTDEKFTNQLVSDEAYNLFQQKKTSYYLTGASELSLSKLYATYSSEQDKFNFGVNFKLGYKDKDDRKSSTKKNKIQWLFTPILESNLKNSFTTLYENGKWKSDIRIGGKVNYFFKGKLNYPGMDHIEKDKLGNTIYSHQETNLIIARNIELTKILNSIDSLEVTKIEIEKNSKLLVDEHLKSIEKIAANNLINDAVKTRTKAYIDMLTSNQNKILNKLIENQLENQKTLDDYKAQIANAEVDELNKNGSYNWFRNYWISLWGFYPVSEKETFISGDNTQNFSSQKLKVWEINAQGNIIFEENNCFSFYGAAGLKVYSNNSATANLMTLVDYYQYEQYTPTSYNNLAVRESNKAYIGKFDEFTTTNMNLGKFFFNSS